MSAIVTKSNILAVTFILITLEWVKMKQEQNLPVEKQTSFRSSKAFYAHNVPSRTIEAS